MTTTQQPQAALKTIMQCGCAASGRIKVAGEFVPGCVTHFCTDVSETQTVSAGRLVMCMACGQTQPSSTSLAFFRGRPDQDYDNHYCGCRGWS